MDSSRFSSLVKAFINLRLVSIALAVYVSLYLIVTWFEHRVFLDDFGIVRRDADKLRFPDNQLVYNITSLIQFFEDIGPKRCPYYSWFLVLEIPFFLSASFLVFVSLLIVTFNLGLAEDALMQPSIESPTRSGNKSRYTTFIHPCYLSILPLLVGLMNGIENMLLLYVLHLASRSTPHPLFVDLVASLSSRVTACKWITIRLVIALSIMVMILGWVRIFSYRWVRGQPLIQFPSGDQQQQNPFVKTGKAKQPPPGLTRAKDISKESFKSGKKKNSKRD